jgi:transcriptional regulator
MNDQDIPAFINEYPFATLISLDATGPIISFAPLYYDAGKHQLVGHLANNNQQISVMEKNSAITTLFHGPDGYISPNWYSDKTQVPTWNFMNVEVKGAVTLLHGDSDKLKLLKELSRVHEQKISSDWTIDKLPEVKLNAMLKAITAFAIQIDSCEGKAKLSQNKHQTERLNLINGLEKLSDSNNRLLAEQMKIIG